MIETMKGSGRKTAVLVGAAILLGLIAVALLFAKHTGDLLAFEAAYVESEKAVGFIETHQHEYERLLIEGMPSRQVLRLFPGPHNSDTLTVAMWVPDSVRARTEHPVATWRQLQNAYGGGYFVVFKNGRLASGLLANAAYDVSDIVDSK